MKNAPNILHVMYSAKNKVREFWKIINPSINNKLSSWHSRSWILPRHCENRSSGHKS
jgi:hypothetical protein